MRATRRSAFLALASALLLLAGCGGMVQDGTEDLRIKAAFDYEVAPDGFKVAFDARDSVGSNLGYHWSFGDAEEAHGWDGPVVSHQYEERGSYVVVLSVVEGESDMWELAEPLRRGRRGPATGEPEPDDVKDSTYHIVNLGDDMSASILALRRGNPATSFYSWDRPTFIATWERHSDRKGEVWYLWQAERNFKYQVWEDGEWQDKWSGWHVPSGWADRHKGQGETWEPGNLFMVPGDAQTNGRLEEVRYRITLTQRNEFGEEAVATLNIRIFTLGC